MAAQRAVVGSSIVSLPALTTKRKRSPLSPWQRVGWTRNCHIPLQQPPQAIKSLQQGIFKGETHTLKHQCGKLEVSRPFPSAAYLCLELSSSLQPRPLRRVQGVPGCPRKEVSPGSQALLLGQSIPEYMKERELRVQERSLAIKRFIRSQV